MTLISILQKVIAVVIVLVIIKVIVKQLGLIKYLPRLIKWYEELQNKGKK